MSTKQEIVLCDRKGNRRPGVALAMRHGLSGLNGLRKEDGRPTYIDSSEEYDILWLYFIPYVG